MVQLWPGKPTRRIGITALVVVLLGGLIGSGVGAKQNATDPEKLFPGEGESPTWAVDTERYRQGQREAEPRKRAAPRPIVPHRVKLALLAGLVLLHLLLSVVVFFDLRRSSQRMSGLWIWIVVLGGVLAAIAYALFRRNRLLDRRGEETPEDGSPRDR